MGFFSQFGTGTQPRDLYPQVLEGQRPRFDTRRGYVCVTIRRMRGSQFKLANALTYTGQELGPCLLFKPFGGRKSATGKQYYTRAARMS